MILLAPLLATLPTVALAEPLTFDATVARAAGEAPTIRAGEATVEARRSAAIAADQLPDPKLQAGIMNLPVTGPDALDPTMMTMLQVGVEQDIPNLAKRHARTGLAESDIRLAEAQLGVTALDLRTMAGLAWIDLAYAQQRLEIAATAEQQLRSYVPAATSAVASGSARPAESLEIRKSIIEIEDARTQIEAERQSAQARLQRVLETTDPKAVGDIPPPTVDAVALRAVLDRNPLLQLSNAEVEQAGAELRAAEADKRPDFGVSVNYGVRERQYGDMLSVMGSITLPIFASRRQEPKIAAAEAERSATLARFEDQRRAVLADFEADLAAWRSAYEQWQRADNELLPLARERATLETASYAAGRAKLTDVIAAKTALALLQIDILTREGEAVKAATTLRLKYEEHRP
jgi:outer membrane protein TolC